LQVSKPASTPADTAGVDQLAIDSAVTRDAPAIAGRNLLVICVSLRSRSFDPAVQRTGSTDGCLAAAGAHGRVTDPR
jgi:hypothetical protein